ALAASRNRTNDATNGGCVQQTSAFPFLLGFLRSLPIRLRDRLCYIRKFRTGPVRLLSGLARARGRDDGRSRLPGACLRKNFKRCLNSFSSPDSRTNISAPQLPTCCTLWALRRRQPTL